MTKETQEIVPVNIKIILDWCRKTQPDLHLMIWNERNNKNLILMLAAAFEAGRDFQLNNSRFPFGEEALQLYKQFSFEMKHGVMTNDELGKYVKFPDGKGCYFKSGVTV